MSGNILCPNIGNLNDIEYALSNVETDVLAYSRIRLLFYTINLRNSSGGSVDVTVRLTKNGSTVVLWDEAIASGAEINRDKGWPIQLIQSGDKITVEPSVASAITAIVGYSEFNQTSR